MDCKAPRCYKTKKEKCTLPNPWIVFNGLVKGKSYSKEKKSTEYAHFLTKYKSVRETGDDKAYRSALCITTKTKKAMEPSYIKNKGSIVSKFVERLMKERKEIEMGCKMTPNIKEFFNQFVPTEITGVPLNPCQMIAKFMLEKCVARNELKYYTFQDTISYGAHGLLMSGTYKQKPIAIKIIPVHKLSRYELSFTIDHNTTKIKSVQEKNIVREFNIQKQVAETDFNNFRVPKIYGDVSIIRSKKNKSHRIAVIVMEKVVNPIDLEKASGVEQTNRLMEIPSFLAELHKKGFIHGDLHLWNVLFTNEKPFVIDYGRSFATREFTNGTKEDLAMLAIMDYIIPLEMVLRNVSIFNNKTIGKMASKYLEAVATPIVKKDLDNLFEQIKERYIFNDIAKYVLSPIPNDKMDLDSLKERYVGISDLRLDPFYSRNRNWCAVLQI